MPFKFCFLFLFLFSFTAFSQDDEYVNDQVLRYDDLIYKKNIRTVQFHESTWDYAPAIIPLNGNKLVELSFDDLDNDQKQYSMTFVHCDANWEPSDLKISEYIEGYQDINIWTFSYSMNTFQKYTHYTITFPQQNSFRFTKSGNYLVYIYLNGDPKNVILSRRLLIYDDKIAFKTTFRQEIAGDNQYNKQHIDFNLLPKNYDLNNPFKDLKVVLVQNNRWDNAVTGIKPTFINGQELVYSLDDASTFDGGNEFRYFDIRSIRFYTEKVKEIYRDNDLKNHVVLYPEDNRRVKPYLYYSDFNGNFMIRNTEVKGDMDTEADYVYVDFFLPYAKPEPNGNFYIMGKLTDWRMTNNSKMSYNYDRSGYEARLYLKQGYYNYIYVLSDDTKKGGDATIVEGNHWDTENDYMIFVYHRKFGTYYDQLICYKVLNTLRKQ